MRGRRANRWLTVLAASMVALGAGLVTAGVASASTPVGHYAVIKFWPSYQVVTLKVPLQQWCPPSKPSCVWMLSVDEPNIPPQTVVGTATGTSGVLVVAYPSNFCGVI